MDFKDLSPELRDRPESAKRPRKSWLSQMRKATSCPKRSSKLFRAESNGRSGAPTGNVIRSVQQTTAESLLKSQA